MKTLGVKMWKELLNRIYIVVGVLFTVLLLAWLFLVLLYFLGSSSATKPPPNIEGLAGKWSAKWDYGLWEPGGTTTRIPGVEELELFANGTYSYKFTDVSGKVVVTTSPKPSYSWLIEKVSSNVPTFGVTLNYTDEKIPLGWSFFDRSYNYVISPYGNTYRLCHIASDPDSPLCLRKVQ